MILAVSFNTPFATGKMYQNVVVEIVKGMHSKIEIKYVKCCE